MVKGSESGRRGCSVPRNRNSDHAEGLSSALVQWASLRAQLVKTLPTMQETLVQSLGQEDPLEKAQATAQYSWASLVAQLVKNPPAMWETWVRSPGWEDALEKGKAIHSSILAWRIPWAV